MNKFNTCDSNAWGLFCPEIGPFRQFFSRSLLHSIITFEAYPITNCYGDDRMNLGYLGRIGLREGIKLWFYI